MKRLFVLGKQVMLAAVLFAGLSFTACEDENVKPTPPAQGQQTPDPDPTPNPDPNPDPDPTPNPDPTPTPTPDKPAGVDLTADGFGKWSDWVNGEKLSDADCAYELGVESSMPYGDGSVNNYIDLTGYTALKLNVASGTPRPLFNRDEDNGQAPDHLIAIPNNEEQTAAYQTVTDNADGSKTYTIDLAKIQEKYGYVHLHSIKGFDGNVNITSMKLEGGSVTPAPTPDPTPVPEADPTKDATALEISTDNGGSELNTDITNGKINVPYIAEVGDKIIIAYETVSDGAKMSVSGLTSAFALSDPIPSCNGVSLTGKYFEMELTDADVASINEAKDTFLGTGFIIITGNDVKITGVYKK